MGWMETCAVDGLCAGACPVDINTGELVKRLRREQHSAWSRRWAMFAARNFSLVERVVRAAPAAYLLTQGPFLVLGHVVDDQHLEVGTFGPALLHKSKGTQ